MSGKAGGGPKAQAADKGKPFPEPPLRQVDWKPSYRLIPSRFPTVGLYDAIARPEDLDVVFAIEALTNPRLRDEIGQISIVPPEERLSGPGSTPIMAAFTHLNPEGSRFSDGSYGVYYAAKDLDTALAEVVHHREIFMSRTAEPPMDLDMRLIEVQLRKRLHDLRGLQDPYPDVYSPDHYGSSQALGRQLRATHSWGIVYSSVRRAGGQCAAVFRPKALIPNPAGAANARHLALHWNGERIDYWYEKGAVQGVRAAGGEGAR